MTFSRRWRYLACSLLGKALSRSLIIILMDTFIHLSIESQSIFQENVRPLDDVSAWHGAAVSSNQQQRESRSSVSPVGWDGWSQKVPESALSKLSAGIVTLSVGYWNWTIFLKIFGIGLNYRPGLSSSHSKRKKLASLARLYDPPLQQEFSTVTLLHCYCFLVTCPFASWPKVHVSLSDLSVLIVVLCRKKRRVHITNLYRHFIICESMMNTGNLAS